MKSSTPVEMVEEAPRPDLAVPDLPEEEQPGKVEVAPLGQDPAVIRRFLWKCDIRLIPCLGIMYLLNSLDRANLGNAKTDGLEADIGLVGNQYNQVLTYYYIPYVLCGPFFALITRLITAKYSLTGMMVFFGSFSIATAFAKNFSQLLTFRLFIGIFESGFLASVVIYMSGFWTRADIASRIGLFFASNVIASAFGGLLAYGTFQITDRHLRGWSYLFIIEGSLTVFFAIIMGLYIPQRLTSARFLTAEEKAAGVARQLADSVDEVDSKFSWNEAIIELRTWHTWIRILIVFSISVPLASNNNFLAPMVARLGYGTAKTNLYTVAPALTAAVFLVAFCFSSDRVRERGLHLCAALMVTTIGYIVLITINVDNLAVSYFALFLTTVGAYPVSPLFSSWCVSNLPNMNSRAFTIGFLIPVGNLSGFLVSNIFINSEAPRYMTALCVNLGFAILAIILCFSYGMWMRWENRRRDRLHGRITALDNHGHGQEYVTDGVLTSKDPRFRFMP
ncbi:hypothetical protein SEUCBS139899_006948 [Sporothrix eucalyptigena]|uniref:Major facilitator superfamily (MFS) profile domain-containing protein n=1 Tax=Sporothrix eucalyptigena TaxID=1812306 RepID=A0ABP0C4F3_9PEZI